MIPSYLRLKYIRYGSLIGLPFLHENARARDYCIFMCDIICQEHRGMLVCADSISALIFWEDLMHTIYCENCGAANLSNWQFCVTCGASLSQLDGTADQSPSNAPVDPPLSKQMHPTPESSVRCDKCGAVNDAEWKFCTACGAPLDPDARRSAKSQAREPRYCPKCGAANESGAKVCISCNTPMDEPAEASTRFGSGTPGGSYARARRMKEHIKIEPVPHEDLPDETDDVFSIIKKALNIYWNNFAVVFGAYWVIQIIMFAAMMVIAAVNFVIPFVSFASFLVTPLVVGVFFVFIHPVRGRDADIGQAFNCLSEKYVPALIASIIQGLIAMIPGMAFAFIVFGTMIFKLGALGTSAPPDDPWGFLLDFIWGIVVFVLFISIFHLFFQYVFILIADHDIDFWRAIVASVKFVWGNFWEVLGISIVASLISLLGILALFIGSLFTAPVYNLIITAYYEARKHKFEV